MIDITLVLVRQLILTQIGYLVYSCQSNGRVVISLHANPLEFFLTVVQYLWGKSPLLRRDSCEIQLINSYAPNMNTVIYKL